MHCVTSKEPGKHLALKLNSLRRPLTHMHDGTVTSVKEGGNQYDMEDLDPELADYIHSMFQRECAKHGTPVRMSHHQVGGTNMVPVFQSTFFFSPPSGKVRV